MNWRIIVSVTAIVLLNSINFGCKGRLISDVSPLIIAVIEGDMEGLKGAIETGVNVNSMDGFGNTALMYALGANELDSARYSSRVNRKLQSNNNQELIEFLLKAGANVNIENNNGGTALILAIYHGNRAATNLLIRSGANVNHKNMYGNTPLVYSVIHCDKETAEDLVVAGADTEIMKSEYGGKTVSEIALDYSCASW